MSPRARAILHYLAIALFLLGLLAVLFDWTLGDEVDLTVLLFGGLFCWALAGVPVWPRRQP